MLKLGECWIHTQKDKKTFLAAVNPEEFQSIDEPIHSIQGAFVSQAVHPKETQTLGCESAGSSRELLIHAQI